MAHIFGKNPQEAIRGLNWIKFCNFATDFPRRRRRRAWRRRCSPPRWCVSTSPAPVSSAWRRSILLLLSSRFFHYNWINSIAWSKSTIRDTRSHFGTVLFLFCPKLWFQNCFGLFFSFVVADRPIWCGRVNQFRFTSKNSLRRGVVDLWNLDFFGTIAPIIPSELLFNSNLFNVQHNEINGRIIS